MQNNNINKIITNSLEVNKDILSKNIKAIIIQIKNALEINKEAIKAANSIDKKNNNGFILDFNMPIILEYKQAKSNQNSNFIEINVSLDEYNVPEIKAMEVFETLGIEYQRENLFLEGSGIIELNLKTGRINQANLRIVGGIKGTFNNIQEIKLKEI